jgi:hypothetical protein
LVFSGTNEPCRRKRKEMKRSVKRSHHVNREGLEIPTLIQKREEYTPLDFMRISRSRLIKENINLELK